MLYDAIIFDFFDVLCPDDFKAWLQRHGYEKEGEFLRASEDLDHGHITPDEFFIRLSELSGQEVEALKLDFKRPPVVDKMVLDVVRQLRKQGLKVGLLSNAPSSFIRGILADNRLERHFDEITISSEVGMIKPSREVFEHMLTRLGVAPSKTIFIDDNQTYVAGAEAIGLHGIQFASADQLKESLLAAGVTL